MKTKLEENYENIVSNGRVRSKFSWYQKGDKKSTIQKLQKSKIQLTGKF